MPRPQNLTPMAKPLTPPEALHRAAALCSSAEHCKADTSSTNSRAGASAPPTAGLSSTASCRNGSSTSHATPSPLSKTNSDSRGGDASKHVMPCNRSVSPAATSTQPWPVSTKSNTPNGCSTCSAPKPLDNRRRPRSPPGQTLPFRYLPGIRKPPYLQRLETDRAMRPFRPLDELLDLFFPRLCPICQRAMNRDERGLCTGCLHRLPRTRYHLDPLSPMAQLFFGKVPIERCAAYLHFTTPGRRQATHTPHQVPRRETMRPHHGRNLCPGADSRRILRGHRRPGARSSPPRQTAASGLQPERMDSPRSSPSHRHNSAHRLAGTHPRHPVANPQRRVRPLDRHPHPPTTPRGLQTSTAITSCSSTTW